MANMPFACNFHGTLYTQSVNLGGKPLGACAVRSLQRAPSRAPPTRALAYPRAADFGKPLPRETHVVAATVQEAAVHASGSMSARPVFYLGSDGDVAGQTLFLHLQADVTVGQVVSICNELAGRVPTWGTQRISGHLRPVSFSTPSGRVDWDPSNEELPAHMWTLLGANARSLKLSMISVTVDSKADLDQLRANLPGIVDYIQSSNYDRIPLSDSL